MVSDVTRHDINAADTCLHLWLDDLVQAITFQERARLERAATAAVHYVAACPGRFCHEASTHTL